MKILAIIPARGGSKGVLKKNIREVAGKPLIAWTIEASKASRFITRTIISTDTEEIATVAKTYGADVPFLRPAELAKDLSTDVEFINHALDFLEKNENYVPDIILRLPPTSPLRTTAHIDEGIQKLLDTPEADSVRPITKAPKHPYKMWKISEDGAWLQPFLPSSFTGFEEPQNMPRQLLPPVYVHTGAMDIIRTASFKKYQSTSGPKVAFFQMPEQDSVNIDSELDLEFADFLLSKAKL